jgi:class 3 adenylate cyclase/predicted ATPase
VSLIGVKCPSCQADVPAGNRFCLECGAEVPVPCAACGKLNPAPAKFCGRCGGKLIVSTDEASVTASARPAKPAPPPAERRQLSVMFCDLVGSTALSARLDPEDLRGVNGTYHGCVAETVARFAGFVAKYMGDGVLVYFGYPGAHEDDVERAVQAGLALVDAVERLPTSEALRVRIGIATGLVVVGDLIGSGASQEQAVVGETPNLAARLQALAEPGSVVVAETTHMLLAGLYEYQDLGAIELKGFAEPIRAWRVLRESAIESRFEALRSGETPLVGRDEELDLFTTRWQQAKGGDGQIVLLSGEPGIGKSRLIASLLDRFQQDPHVRLRYFCTPHHRDSALFPFIAQLERAARFERVDTPEERFAKLEALLASVSDRPSEQIPVFAELLSVPIPPRYAPLGLSPQQMRGRTLEALLGQIEALARNQPVLLIFEDLQWIDPTSGELLDLVIKRVGSLTILLIATFRPEFIAPWKGFSYVTLHALNRLTRSEAVSLIEGLTGGKAMPPEALEQILQRADGVPLFIEELTKTVLEGGFLQEQTDRYVVNRPLPPFAIPSTLQASLMARLDRIAPAKEVAQIGAVIGREFSYELLAAVAAGSDQDLQSALDQLTDSGLMLRRGVPPNAAYAFKHALIQDAAYATLLRSRRLELHAHIANILEERFPETIETQPELLGRHFSEAGLAESAIPYWQRAGERAIKRSANLEAVAHFQRGLEALEALPDKSARAEQELRLLIGLGPALMLTRSSIAPEITQVYARARQLASQIGQEVELFKSVWGLTNVANVGGDLPALRRLTDELFDIARKQEDAGLLLQAHHAAWGPAMNSGAFVEARKHVEAGLALYRREMHGQHAHIYGGHDPGWCAYAAGAQIACILGHSEDAIRMSEGGLALARDLAHPPTLARALADAAELRIFRRELLAVEELVGSLLPLVSKHGSAVGVANAKMLHGWVLVALGGADEGIVELRLGLEAWRASGSKFMGAYQLGRAADAYRMAGLAEEALRYITDAVKAMESSGSRWFEAELHRLRGELLLSGGDQHEAEVCYRRAIAVAHEQSARLFELRSANSLAQLWRDRGQNDNARELLAPIFAWFTDGFDIVDLREAKALLDELR